MALEDFFDHTCDIYHILEEAVSPGYGLPASPAFSYPEAPDIAALKCHFGIKTDGTELQQTRPVNYMVSATKLTLPAGTDVRLNDRIVDCGTGYVYTARVPHSIRGHHVYVWVEMRDMDRQKDL